MVGREVAVMRNGLPLPIRFPSGRRSTGGGGGLLAAASAESRPPRGRGPTWKPSVGIQIVSCGLAHIVPDTGWVRFSRTFVGEPGSPASLRHLSHCLEALLVSMRILAWPGSFLSGSSLPPAQCEPDPTNECAKQHQAFRAAGRSGRQAGLRSTLGARGYACPDRSSRATAPLLDYGTQAAGLALGRRC